MTGGSTALGREIGADLAVEEADGGVDDTGHGAAHHPGEGQDGLVAEQGHADVEGGGVVDGERRDQGGVVGRQTLGQAQSSDAVDGGAGPAGHFGQRDAVGGAEGGQVGAQGVEDAVGIGFHHLFDGGAALVEEFEQGQPVGAGR
jgi:hypothetical protein